MSELLTATNKKSAWLVALSFFKKLLKNACFDGLFGSATGRLTCGYTVLGPLLPHTLCFSFAQSFQCLLARNLLLLLKDFALFLC